MTAAWRLQMRQGSFRGVKFFVDSHDFEGGRRLVDHIYPFRDDAWIEDMGRKQRSYKLNAYIVGDDYFPSRDAFLDALEKGGPGILVHPYLGTKTVEAGEFNVKESRENGGLCYIDVTFKESSKTVAPDGALDQLSNARDKANAVQLALQRAFSAFNSPSPTSFVFGSAISLVNKVSDTLQTASNGIPKADTGAADLGYAIRNMKANSRTLVAKPNQLSQVVKDSFHTLTAAMNINGLLPEDSNGKVILPQTQVMAEAKKGAVLRGAFAPLIDYGNGLPPTYTTTDSRKLEAQNQNLMRQLVVGSALGEAVYVSVGTTYGTYDDAIAQRDYLVEKIEDMLGDPTLGDEVYDSLQDLMAAAVDAIPDPESEVPRLNKINLPSVTPSLVISYELYESSLNESDIIARNRISHPGFISPLKPLEVIGGD